MKQTIKTCIILVNYNGAGDTIACIESLLSLSAQSFKIVICDNNSHDDSINKICKWFNKSIWKKKYSEITLIKNHKKYSNKGKLSKISIVRSTINLGFAGGNNLAARIAIQNDFFDYIWFLNNDTVVLKNSLSELVSYAKKLPSNVGIIGSKLMYYSNPKIIQTIGGNINILTGQPSHIGGGEEDKGQYDNPLIHMDYIVGASMFVSNKMITSTGLMSEHYFLYYEEIDWITRIKNQGWTIGYCPKSVVFHKEGATTGGRRSGNKSLLSAYYSTRSSLIYNFIFNKRFFIFVFAYTIIITFSKLFHFKINSFAGMVKGFLGFFRFLLIPKRTDSHG
jgi:GT2 family glycosyltransferase